MRPQRAGISKLKIIDLSMPQNFQTSRPENALQPMKRILTHGSLAAGAVWYGML